MAFRDHFAEIIPSINTFKWTGNVKSLVNHVYITDRSLLKLYNHSSIKMIKKIRKFFPGTGYVSRCWKSHKRYKVR